jgi:hypothetical protein
MNKVSVYSFFKKTMNVNSILTIQKNIRGYLSRKQTNQMICKNIISLLNQSIYTDILQECYFQILQVLKQFPPAKNEYKFIYGKLIEQIIINTLNTIKKCVSLDDAHTSGSEYKYDCTFHGIPLSIKASKNISNITIINKNSNSKHYIGNMNFAICYILEKKLCIFPCSVIEKKCIGYQDSKIEFKAKIFKSLNEWSVQFPELSHTQMEYIGSLKEVDSYTHLYNTFIKKG